MRNGWGFGLSGHVSERNALLYTESFQLADRPQMEQWLSEIALRQTFVGREMFWELC